jgi:hypothetical protein
MPKKFLSIADVYVAYRKPKADAFYGSTHCHAAAYAEYERDLHDNLTKLYRRLLETHPTWQFDLTFIGDQAYLPKSMDTSTWDNRNEGHFIAMDPLDDWVYKFKKNKTRATAKLRLIIRPTVNF